MSGQPLDVLEAALGETVVVELKDDARYRGTLAGYDQHMNVVLEEPATDAEGDAESVEGTIVIRGDNVVSIRP